MESDATHRATYTAEQFAPLYAAEDRHFWFSSRNRCIAAALRSLPDFHRLEAILEVGCGTGVVLAELQRVFPNGHVVGMDLFEQGLSFARRRFRGPLIQGDVFTHEFDRPFDVIGAFDVIEHLDDDEALLRRLHDQLQPGGHLLVTVPAHAMLWSYFDEVACHRRRYSIAELRRKLIAAGFQLQHVTQFMAALFPPMWLRRRFFGERAAQLSRASSAQRQAAAESDLHVPSWLNALFKFALWPEPLFVSRRWRLPMGTSLLAVAARPNRADPHRPPSHSVPC